MATEEQKQQVPCETQKNEGLQCSHPESTTKDLSPLLLWPPLIGVTDDMLSPKPHADPSFLYPSTHHPSTQQTFWNVCSRLQSLSLMTTLSKPLS